MAFATTAAASAVRPALLSRPALPQRRPAQIRASRAVRAVRVVPTMMATKMPSMPTLTLNAEKVAAMGAFTALTAANPCLAATELHELAGIDSRLGLFALLFGPVLGWVAFNILGPALNQLDKMDDKKALVGGLGISAAAMLATAPGAEAATEIAQVAGIDSRLGLFALLFGPVLGWVAFNILGPALNQLDKMDDKKALVGGLGFSAAAMLATAPGAEAATEIAQVAGIDSRLGLFALVFVPVLGWVAFNILGPALNQLDKMDDKKALVGGMGISAAAMLATAPGAEAATEIFQVAEIDGRLGLFALVFVPVLGWVAFNILGPALNQLDKMDDKKV